jgi:hypothetical protein
MLGEFGLIWPWESLHVEARAWFDHWLKAVTRASLKGPLSDTSCLARTTGTLPIRGRRRAATANSHCALTVRWLKRRASQATASTWCWAPA